MSIPYGPILVVEDVPHILELLEVTLRFKGYPVHTARNGEEALVQVAKEKPALVITDILSLSWMASHWCINFAPTRKPAASRS